jgi:hypothetical protein
MSKSSIVKVAVTQHEPVWFDLTATVDKTCKLIAEAAREDAKLVVFPEVWIPGYPAWVWCVFLFAFSVFVFFCHIHEVRYAGQQQQQRWLKHTSIRLRFTNMRK